MIPWGAKRKLTMLLTVVISLFVIALAIMLFASYHPPSCHDNIQNQSEFGVDCGGPCANLCKSQTLDPIVHWQRAFMVVPGVYNAVAYVENPNSDSVVVSVPYTFSLYDTDNLLITQRSGVTFIPANKVFAIFEATIQTGSRIPARVAFSFDQSSFSWTKTKMLEPEIRITDVALYNKSTLPLINAKLTNDTFTPIHNFDVVVVIYDKAGNAQAASKTIVDMLGPNLSQTVNYSWPNKFNFNAAKIEIIPKLFAGLNY